MRLKVNEGKTTYMVLASMGRRRLEDLSSEIVICGKAVKNVKVGKSLGLLVSDDLTWRHQTEKVVKSCREKLAGLWKCTDVLKKQERKTKAEAVIMSRLSYCLEVVSTGRKGDMEKMQGVQSAAARWVAQTRKRDWHVKSGLKKLGWLSICQQAAYVSLKTAMKVLRNKKPERLHNTLTEEVGDERIRKVLDENKVMKLKASTRKAWSIRSLRWMAQMPEELIKKDIGLQSTKTELKKWIRGRVPVKGDRILWGQKLTAEMERKRRPGNAGPESDNGRDGNEDSTGGIHEEDENIDVTDAAEEMEEPQDQINNSVNIATAMKKKRMKEKLRNWGTYGKTRRSGKSKGTGRGGWVPEGLPRAGVEPPNPGKGGSLSPLVKEGYTTGQLLMMWSVLFLTLISFMSLRKAENGGRRRQLHQKSQYSEEEGEWVRSRNQRKKIIQPRCGIG